MSLFHFHVTQIKRSSGQSAVACAAYRAGEKLKSEYYGEVSDYTRKGGVVESGIMLPEYVPQNLSDRETLWNEVEKIEKGKKAQLAYSFDFALQNEFTMEENISLAKKFIREQFVERGMIADFAIHSPETNGIANPHVHVMCPIRPIEEIKSELEKFSQPETTLVDILNTYLDMRKEERSDWNKSAQTKGAVADLKKISQAIMILQTRNICTLDELNEILKPIDEMRKSIKADEKKIKRLKQHISKIEDYEKYKPIYDKYSKIFFEKSKEKYYAEHESEIEKYKTAVRYMKANPECKPSAKVDIKSEISALTEHQKSLTANLSIHQSELRELEEIRYIVNQAMAHKENEKPSVLKRLEEAKKLTPQSNRSDYKKQEQNIE